MVGADIAFCTEEVEVLSALTGALCNTLSVEIDLFSRLFVDKVDVALAEDVACVDTAGLICALGVAVVSVDLATGVDCTLSEVVVCDVLPLRALFCLKGRRKLLFD